MHSLCVCQWLSVCHWLPWFFWGDRWVMTDMYFHCALGGDGGRPNSAGNSLNPCVHCERSPRWWPGCSREGASVSKTSADVVWQDSVPFTELLYLEIIGLSHLFPQLNFYTPLRQSAQAQFVPEEPGVIESGVTTARKTILPLVQAVQVLMLCCVHLRQNEFICSIYSHPVQHHATQPPVTEWHIVVM